MTIDEIKNMPTCYKSLSGRESHESLLRSYHILNKIIEMVDREDSKETIIEVFKFLRDFKIKEKQE